MKYEEIKEEGHRLGFVLVPLTVNVVATVRAVARGQDRASVLVHDVKGLSPTAACNRLAQAARMGFIEFDAMVGRQKVYRMTAYGASMPWVAEKEEGAR